MQRRRLTTEHGLIIIFMIVFAVIIAGTIVAVVIAWPDITAPSPFAGSRAAQGEVFEVPRDAEGGWSVAGIIVSSRSPIHGESIAELYPIRYGLMGTP